MRQIGTVTEFLEWFDVVRGTTRLVRTHPRPNGTAARMRFVNYDPAGDARQACSRSDLTAVRD